MVARAENHNRKIDSDRDNELYNDQRSEVMSAKSAYRRYSSDQLRTRHNTGNTNETRKQTRPCPGCGSHSHGQRGSSDRLSKCKNVIIAKFITISAVYARRSTIETQIKVKD